MQPVTPNSTKTCTRCRTEKPTHEFYACKARGGRPTPHCKACNNLLTTAYRNKRKIAGIPEASREKSREANRRSKTKRREAIAAAAAIATTKMCRKCQQQKALSDFSRRVNAIDGLANTCRHCLSLAMAREPKPLPTEKYCNDCKSTKPIADFWPRRDRRNAAVSRCKLCCMQHHNKWRKENKDTPERKAKSREYTQKWRDKNDERYKSVQKRYKTSPAGKATKRKYLTSEHGAAKAREDSRKRRQAKLGVNEVFTRDMEAALREAFENQCFVSAITDTEHRELTGRTLAIDHVVPLSQGAPLTFENACLLSLSANSSKGARGWEFFSPSQQRRLRRLQAKAAKIYASSIK